MVRLLKKYPTSALLLLLSGCFPADLPQIEAPPAVSRLHDLADASIGLSVNTTPVAGHRGYQYLTAIPVTRIYTPDLAQEVTDQLKVQGGLKGYRMVEPTTPSDQVAFNLEVTVQDLTVSGYCYLLVRRPHSDVVLNATLRSPDGALVRECTGVGDVTYTAKFAFSEQLNEARRSALTQAAVALVECLALPKPRQAR
jgi:hypothetical protein